MIKLLTFVIFFAYSIVASASRCGAEIQIENTTNKEKTVSICLESQIDNLEKCDYPDEHILKAHETKSISLVFMCGYPNDPPIEKYWVLFATSDKFQKVKYVKDHVILVK
jgi:hypothetical protein